MITKQKGVVDMFGLTFGIAAIAALGVGASSFMEYFHNFKFKNKKKGDKDDNYKGESLREKAKTAR